MTTDPTRPEPHPGHALQVTGGGPMGHAWADCSCGWTLRCGSKYAANRNALAHHHLVGGCNCPAALVALDVHPRSATEELSHA